MHCEHRKGMLVVAELWSVAGGNQIGDDVRCCYQ